MTDEGIGKIMFNAGVQYKAGGHTITFSQDMRAGSLMCNQTVTEIDGKPPFGGQMLPHPLSAILAGAGHE